MCHPLHVHWKFAHPALVRMIYPWHTWYTQKICVLDTGEVLTWNISVPRPGYLFNWPRCASSNNTCYTLKLERLFSRSVPPCLSSSLTFNAPPPKRYGNTVVILALWLLKRRSTGHGTVGCLLNFCYSSGKRLLSIRREYRENVYVRECEASGALVSRTV